MATLQWIIHVFLHLNTELNRFAGDHPTGVYAALVAIVFMETGLVVTPFLPGDSLLFAVGALAATAGSPIHLPLIILLLCLAANCGDITNYFLGRTIGPRIFFTPAAAWATNSQTQSASGDVLGYATPNPPKPALWQRLLSQRHLAEAQAFYERHGRKTIIIARFVPIIRTFAPFVAGIGKMAFSRFIGFSVFGGIFWVTSVSLCGYFFGGIPFVKAHFEIVVLAIVAISLLPILIHAMQGKKEPREFEPATPPAK